MINLKKQVSAKEKAIARLLWPNNVQPISFKTKVRDWLRAEYYVMFHGFKRAIIDRRKAAIKYMYDYSEDQAIAISTVQTSAVAFEGWTKKEFGHNAFYRTLDFVHVSKSIFN